MFSVLEGVQDSVILDGAIYLDETYLTKRSNKIENINGKKLRGISCNKIGVAVATNKSKSIIISTGVSKPSFRSTEKSYLSHIAPGSKIIHDMEKSHNILVSKLNLESIAYNSSQLKGLPDNKNPLYLVNRLHFL